MSRARSAYELGRFTHGLYGTLRLPEALEQEEAVSELMRRCCEQLQEQPDDQCSVCLDGFTRSTPALRLKVCRHTFHCQCLERSLQYKQRCPVCSAACGILHGSGPKVGTMTWHESSTSLPGYPGAGTITLTFDFPAGTDPTGHYYSSRQVCGYLPNVTAGLQVLEFFKTAFRRRLLFTIGTSLTLGTRWPTFNIHLKTSVTGGSTNHGYPDPGYLDRVLQELAECGIGRVAPAGVKEKAACLSSSSAGASSAVRPPPPEGSPKRRKTFIDVEVEEVDLVSPDVWQQLVPCELCSAKVPFERYAQHMQGHEDQSLVLVPCDLCGKQVPFSEFQVHEALHRSEESVQEVGPRQQCEVCHQLLLPGELLEHRAAHRIQEELHQADLQSSTADADLAMQVVEHSRKGGSGLPGNARRTRESDPVLVRWSDGHWYKGYVKAEQPDGKLRVAWDPPYSHSPEEDVDPAQIVPRQNQPREVCNFDVAMAFVRKAKAFATEEHRRGKIEIVYHYTSEETVQTIVENSLKVPGSSNSDGSVVPLKNGAAYGTGIYTASNIQYGKAYGAGLSCSFLCLALPGHRAQTGAGRIGEKDDSFTHGDLRLFKVSEQLLPLFFTDEKHAARLHSCAESIAEFLDGKLAEVPITVAPTAASSSGWNVGDPVEAFSRRRWWPGTILHVVHSYQVVGAGGAGARVNGRYVPFSLHNGKPKFKQESGRGIIFFDGQWKLNYKDDTSWCLYSKNRQSSSPPSGSWTTEGSQGDVDPPPSLRSEAQPPSFFVAWGRPYESYPPEIVPLSLLRRPGGG